MGTKKLWILELGYTDGWDDFGKRYEIYPDRDTAWAAGEVHEANKDPESWGFPYFNTWEAEVK